MQSVKGINFSLTKTRKTLVGIEPPVDLYVIVMSCTIFRLNPHSVVA